MLKSLLNLLPAKVVKCIGDKSFANLKDRGEINVWLVNFPKDSSLLSTDKDSQFPLEK